MEDLLARARQCLQHAAHIAVLSGAGISAESGVPTFRDAQTGLWARFRPEELATEDAFRRHPERVWDWYAERRASLAAVQPNAGHLALAGFERRHPGRLTVIQGEVPERGCGSCNCSMWARIASARDSALSASVSANSKTNSSPP